MALKFESSVKYVSYSQEQVYGVLSDLSNIKKVAKVFDVQRPGMEFQMKFVDDDTMEIQAKGTTVLIHIVGPDALEITAKGVSSTLRVVEREELKLVKLGGENSPISFNIWIQILPVDAAQAKLKVTLGVDVSMFMKPMVSKPCKEGVEMFANLLSVFHYDMLSD